MNSHFMTRVCLKKYKSLYYAASELPHKGVLYAFDNEKIYRERLEGLKNIYLMSHKENLICVQVEDEVVLGDVEVCTSNEFPEVQYFRKNVFKANPKDWSDERIRLRDEEGSYYELEGEYLIAGYVSGIFYGTDLNSNLIVGIEKGERCWEVPYRKGHGVPHPFLCQDNFYLYSDDVLQSFSFQNGELNYEYPVDSVPTLVYELNDIAAIQNQKELFVLDKGGEELGKLSLVFGSQFEHEGSCLLGLDGSYVYVVERGDTEQNIVVYDYQMQELRRVGIPLQFDLSFQYVSEELNALNLNMEREKIIGSSIMSFWNPNETLSIQSFIPSEQPFNVERIIEQNVASYEVSIEADNKHDLFRICDVIVLDVANKYGEDYCERPDVDRQFGGDIRVLVNPKLFNEEPEWMITVQERLNNLIKEYGGNMHSGVVSGDKKKHIEVVLVPANT